MHYFEQGWVNDFRLIAPKQQTENEFSKCLFVFFTGNEVYLGSK